MEEVLCHDEKRKRRSDLYHKDRRATLAMTIKNFDKPLMKYGTKQALPGIEKGY